MISDLYKAHTTRRGERTIGGRPRSSNVPPITYIDEEIDDGTSPTDMSVITMEPGIPATTK